MRMCDLSCVRVCVCVRVIACTLRILVNQAAVEAVPSTYGTVWTPLSKATPCPLFLARRG